MAAHPDFPWLDAGDVPGVARFLAASGWLEPDEVVRRCERAGEGNMNLTLRVHTDRRRLVVKQARPWVEKYDHVAAPWERSTSERRFYERVAGIPGVADRMPALLGADAEARALLLEDLPGARDCSGMYRGERLAPDEVQALAAYLRALHAATAGPPDPTLANRAMRALNHEHCFVLPFTAGNGLDLDRFEPGLRRVADALAADGGVRVRVAELGRRYLGDGPCLVHGDYFPGSWLRTDRGLCCIDPEFSFQGEPELDLGVAIAHLVIAGADERTAEAFLGAYGPHDAALTAGHAAVEVVRRLCGVAQLPLPASEGTRAALVARACTVLAGGGLDAFWR